MGVQETAPSPFATFSRQRASLNERIDEAGRDIDAWFERRRPGTPPYALAQLQELLEARRDLLAQLAALDDEFVSWLLSVHGRD